MTRVDQAASMTSSAIESSSLSLRMSSIYGNSHSRSRKYLTCPAVENASDPRQANGLRGMVRKPTRESLPRSVVQKPPISLPLRTPVRRPGTEGLLPPVAPRGAAGRRNVVQLPIHTLEPGCISALEPRSASRTASPGRRSAGVLSPRQMVSFPRLPIAGRFGFPSPSRYGRRALP